MKKKLFAILMSAMMMVTFMPALAFAASGAPNDWVGLRSVSSTTEVAVETQIFNNAQMVKEGKYTTIDTAKMKKWIDSGKKMVLIDTMPASQWNNAHLPGAVNCVAPMGKYMNTELKWEAGQKTALKKAVGYKSKAKAKKSKQVIVVYCGFCGCDRSHYGAKYLKSLGYKNVYRYVGGGAAWEDAGYDFENAAGEIVKAHSKPVA